MMWFVGCPIQTGDVSSPSRAISARVACVSTARRHGNRCGSATYIIVIIKVSIVLSMCPGVRLLTPCTCMNGKRPRKCQHCMRTAKHPFTCERPAFSNQGCLKSTLHFADLLMDDLETTSSDRTHGCASVHKHSAVPFQTL